MGIGLGLGLGLGLRLRLGSGLGLDLGVGLQRDAAEQRCELDVHAPRLEALAQALLALRTHAQQRLPHLVRG